MQLAIFGTILAAIPEFVVTEPLTQNTALNYEDEDVASMGTWKIADHTRAITQEPHERVHERALSWSVAYRTTLTERSQSLMTSPNDINPTCCEQVLVATL